MVDRRTGRLRIMGTCILYNAACWPYGSDEIKLQCNSFDKKIMMRILFLF